MDKHPSAWKPVKIIWFILSQPPRTARRREKQTAWDLILRKRLSCVVLSAGDVTTTVKNAADISDYSKVKQRASELERTAMKPVEFVFLNLLLL